MATPRKPEYPSCAQCAATLGRKHYLFLRLYPRDGVVTCAQEKCYNRLEQRLLMQGWGLVQLSKTSNGITMAEWRDGSSVLYVLRSWTLPR